MKFKLILFLLLISLLLIASCSNSSNNDNNDNNDVSNNNDAGNDGKVKVQIFKSSSCGCCDAYSKYMDKKGYDVEVKNVGADELSVIKSKYGVPSEIQSCHTMIIGDYFVEGHVPIEAVEKMMVENPDISGIGIVGGMPSGSPGMPGQKAGEWRISSIKESKVIGDYMVI